MMVGLVLSGCADRAPKTDIGRETATASSDSESSKPLRVVATYSILGDWVRRIGGENIELTVLVGPEGDAHTYEPTPQDSVALAKADVVFENGLGFEVWLDRLYEASESKGKRIVVTDSIKPRQVVISESQTETDPHVWHLPANAILMANSIASAFETADPSRSSQYRSREQSYVKELNELDAWITKQINSIPNDRRKLVTTHDTFGYLADKYGLEVLSVLGSVSSDSSDPSAGQIAEIINRIRASKVPAIFAENILNPKLTNQVAQEAGVKIVPTLYTDALGPKGSPGEDYLSMMRFNITTMVEALR
jgi:zinc/manganese transport system substrate-binding protein